LSQNEDLLLLLGQIAKSRSDIRLLNIYKGLPISYDTSINSVGEFEINVSGNRQQIACLYYQRETYLQGDKFPFLIRSQVISLNLDKENAVLADFEVAKSDIGKREQIRVEPDEPPIAYIQFVSSGYEISSSLADVSAEGGRIYLEAQLFPARLFQPGNEITIAISFPDNVSQKMKKISTKTQLETRGSKPIIHTNLPAWQNGKVTITGRGKIVSVRPELHLNRYRVGMKLYFQDLARMVILQYVSQRQAEIIRDLHILSDELYSRKK